MIYSDKNTALIIAMAGKILYPVNISFCWLISLICIKSVIVLVYWSDNF